MGTRCRVSGFKFVNLSSRALSQRTATFGTSDGMPQQFARKEDLAHSLGRKQERKRKDDEQEVKTTSNLQLIPQQFKQQIHRHTFQRQIVQAHRCHCCISLPTGAVACHSIEPHVNQESCMMTPRAGTPAW